MYPLRNCARSMNAARKVVHQKHVSLLVEEREPNVAARVADLAAHRIRPRPKASAGTAGPLDGPLTKQFGESAHGALDDFHVTDSPVLKQLERDDDFAARVEFRLVDQQVPRVLHRLHESP